MGLFKQLNPTQNRKAISNPHFGDEGMHRSVRDHLKMSSIPQTSVLSVPLPTAKTPVAGQNWQCWCQQLAVSPLWSQMSIRL